MSLEVFLSIMAIVIAATGLYFAWRGHQARVKERKAKAGFEISIRTVGADKNEIRWTKADIQMTRIGIGVKNIGERPAGETLINVVIPDHLQTARWCGPSGEEVADGEATAPTRELLPNHRGEEKIKSKYLSTTWPRINLRPHYEKFVQFPVQLPSRDSALKQTTVPVRVRIQADELPDDVAEYVLDYVVHVVRSG